MTGAPRVESISTSGAFVAAPAVFGTNYFIGNTGGSLFHLRANSANTALSLSPAAALANPTSKRMLFLVSKSFGPLLSSPIVFGQGTGFLQVDYNGKVVAWKINGKKILWTVKLSQEVSDNRQPVLTQDGTLLVGLANTIVAYGGSGGCKKGYRTNPLHEVDAFRPDNFCEICGHGNVSTTVASPVCSRCSEGQWAWKPGSTFCYTCSQFEYCRGGAHCAAGNRGTMCYFCKRGYYMLYRTCVACPDSPFIYTLAVLGGIFILMQVYMGFTQGTKFAYEVSKDDVIALYINNGDFCQRCMNRVSCGVLGTKSVRVERKVTRVIDDYTMEVSIGSNGA